MSTSEQEWMAAGLASKAQRWLDDGYALRTVANAFATVTDELWLAIVKEVSDEQTSGQVSEAQARTVSLDSDEEPSEEAGRRG